MFDLALRPLKDTLFTPLAGLVPARISPTHITVAAFCAGLGACSATAAAASASAGPALALSLWALNRALDCLDGALARHRGAASDRGAFLDLLGDFIVYSLIPISCAMGAEAEAEAAGVQAASLWRAVAVLEASFHINNFVLFFVAAASDKAGRRAVVAGGEGGGGHVEGDGSGGSRRSSGGRERQRELTSISMRPALVEGVESGLLFTWMLAAPAQTEMLCWVMAALVAVGTGQRVVWALGVL